MNILNKEKIKKADIFTFLLVCYVVIQPMLELMCLNNGTFNEVLGFKLPTLIRIVGIGIIGLFSLYSIKFSKKHQLLIVYAFIIIIYFALHHVNTLDFTSLVIGNFGYSIVEEFFYVIRMCIPIAMIYFVCNSNINYKIFNLCVLSITIFMSLLCVIANLSETAIGSYSDGIIAGSIIDWFINKGMYDYYDLASKGYFFHSIVSTILVLLLPYIFYLYISTQKYRYLFLAIIQSAALFMFGTKATTYSVIIISIIMLIMYIFFSAIWKEFKFCIRIILTLSITCLITVCVIEYTPAVARTSFDQEYQAEIDQEELENPLEVMYDFSQRDQVILFFDNHNKNLSIQETILTERYSYRDDPEFWLELYESTAPSQRMHNRFIQEEVLKRVYEINDNPYDKYFGISYSRTSSIFNLEKDFLYQYYSMGMIGAVLLVGPYIIILILIIFKILFKYKGNMNLCNCSLVLGCGLTCCLAYFSGNTLESLGITIVLGATYGYLLKSIFKNSDLVENTVL